MNDDNFGATQIFPVAGSRSIRRTVNVSWYDTRLDPLNRKTQMVYARSIDGGVSFEPNVLVTDGGSAWRNNVNYTDENSADNTTFNGNQYGDYSGIAAFEPSGPSAVDRLAHVLPGRRHAVADAPGRQRDRQRIVNCSAPSAIAAPAVNSTTAPSVAVSWSAPAGWGTNATNGTYSVYRDTDPVFPGGSPSARA